MRGGGKGFCGTVADYNGNKRKVSFVEDPSKPPYGPFNWDKFFNYTIQQFNFKAKNKPFICFEPGNKMWLRYENLNGLLSSYRLQPLAGGPGQMRRPVRWPKRR
jgi:hypothetical protein